MYKITTTAGHSRCIPCLYYPIFSTFSLLQNTKSSYQVSQTHQTRENVRRFRENAADPRFCPAPPEKFLLQKNKAADRCLVLLPTAFCTFLLF